MPWKPGQSGNPRGRLPDKLFADQLRMVLFEEDKVTGRRKMRVIAEKLVEQAIAGEGWAIQQVADRIDGKPAQETNLNIDHKHARTDYTRDDLVEIIRTASAEISASGGGNVMANGRGDESDSVH